MRPTDDTELYDDPWWTDAERDIDRTRRALLRARRLRAWDWPRTVVLVVTVALWSWALWTVVDGMLP